MNRIALCVIALVAFHATAVTAESKPNVLLIVTDEHNFRTLGCYREGLPREQAEMWGLGAVVETPNIDRLANEGVLCTRAYATSPVCSPCRAAMMTGRYPHVVGVPTNNRILDRSVPTLADRLNDAGYRSSYIGKWHLSGNGKPEWSPKVDGGFQHKTFMYNRGHWKKFALTDGKPSVGAETKGKPSYNVANADKTSFSTDWLTDRTVEFINDKGEGKEKPFFAVVSYPDPHGPNTVRKPYDTRFSDLPFKPPRTYQTGLQVPKWIAGGKNHAKFRGDSMALYFGMVQCIDDNIGRLIESLNKSGQLNNTLIVLTSDHGDLCYEHDRLNKGNPYEGSARVPMILRQPGRIQSGQVYTKPVGTVDLTPTVMGLLDLPSDNEDQGRNLASVLSKSSEELPGGKESEITFLRNAGTNPVWLAAVNQRYKLIVSVNDSPWLFDAVEDPDELKNFYGRTETAAISKKLAVALIDYGKRVDDPHVEAPNIAASLNQIVAE